MKQEKVLGFLYNTAVGRVFLKLLTSRPLSRLGRAFMRSPLSRSKVKSFIQNNSIDMAEFEDRRFSSFNDFFTRKLKPGARDIAPPERFICPCDSALSAYEITPELTFFIKGAPYSVSTLLGGDEAASDFSGGSCLIFRLRVEDYHHYHYFDDGRTVKPPVAIDGVLHTVNPISLGRYNFFHQNSREYTIVDTVHFGRAAYCEIGAMMVGRIVNFENKDFCGGDEKGYFEFGGSTVVVLLDRNHRINDRFYKNTADGIETEVKFGQPLL